jgi:hypothetical protein
MDEEEKLAQDGKEKKASEEMWRKQNNKENFHNFNCNRTTIKLKIIVIAIIIITLTRI